MQQGGGAGVWKVAMRQFEMIYPGRREAAWAA